MGSSSSSSSSSSASLERKNEGKNLYSLNDIEKKAKIRNIYKVRVPFFDKKVGQFFSNVGTVLSGAITGKPNLSEHVGLIFYTSDNLYYVAQTYRITFEKFDSKNDATKSIIEFCTVNKNSKKEKVNEITSFEKGRTIQDVYDILVKMRDYYHLIYWNCQDFCRHILSKLYD